MPGGGVTRISVGGSPSGALPRGAGGTFDGEVPRVLANRTTARTMAAPIAHGFQRTAPATADTAPAAGAGNATGPTPGIDTAPASASASSPADGRWSGSIDTARSIAAATSAGS